VAYPSVDLKFKNTSDVPVYVAVSMGKRTINVIFYGKKVPGKDVVLAASGRELIRTKTTLHTDPNLPAGARVVEKPGLNGHRINLYRIIKQDGEVTRRELISKDYYRPQKREVAVGPSEKVPEAPEE
jgi:vancomycin resistance protein YoaR